MPRPIPYALINGARASFVSNVFKIDGQEFAGFSSLEAERNRERAMVYGANPDPLGKTRGKNTYKLTAKVYLAEFKAFITDHFGAGYGDVFFSVEWTVIENGFDVQTYVAQGCTIDKTAISSSEGTEATPVEIDFMPVKIIFNDTDDNASPLQGAPANA